MEKMTHKQLINEGERLGGYKLGNGNIYHYENIIACLHNIANIKPYELTTLEKEGARALYDKLLNNGVFSTCAYQTAYACGIYGNIGQLHEIRLYNEQHEQIGTIYSYV